MRTMERNRIQQVIERFSKKQITQHIKSLSEQIAAIEGQVDDEIDSAAIPSSKPLPPGSKPMGKPFKVI